MIMSFGHISLSFRCRALTWQWTPNFQTIVYSTVLVIMALVFLQHFSINRHSTWHVSFQFPMDLSSTTMSSFLWNFSHLSILHLNMHRLHIPLDFQLHFYCTAGPNMSIVDFCSTYNLGPSVAKTLHLNGYVDTTTFEFTEISQLQSFLNSSSVAQFMWLFCAGLLCMDNSYFSSHSAPALKCYIACIL